MPEFTRLEKMQAKTALRLIRNGGLATILSCAMSAAWAPTGSRQVSGYTALHGAACKGDADRVKLLLRLGYSAKTRYWLFERYDAGNALTEYFDCLLSSRTSWKDKRAVNWQLVRTLLDDGADINVADYSLHKTPLMMAVDRPDREDHFELIEFLVRNGASFEPYTTRNALVRGTRPLVSAAHSRRPATVRRLIELGAPVRELEINAHVFLPWRDVTFCSKYAEVTAGLAPPSLADEHRQNYRHYHLRRHEEWTASASEVIDILVAHGVKPYACVFERLTEVCREPAGPSRLTWGENALERYVAGKYSSVMDIDRTRCSRERGFTPQLLNIGR